MGKRSGTASLAQIMIRLLETRTCRQADLATALGLSVRTIRRCMGELQDAGVPLVREEEHSDVFWSVPKSWFPGAVLVERQDLPALARLLARLPRGRERDRFMTKLLALEPSEHDTNAEIEIAEDVLKVIEDGIAHQSALRIHYFSASRGEESWRVVSVQRLFHTPPARLVAMCHRTSELRWFRCSRVRQAQPEPGEPYRKSDPAAVDTYVGESIAGYRDDTPLVRSAFHVKLPDSRWVVQNLPPGKFEHVATPTGVRIEVTSRAITTLARFVTGLGACAVVETPELRAAVRALAQGALRGADKPAIAKAKVPRRRRASPASRS